MDFQKIVAARYAQTETETDAFGRAITVGRLRMGQQLRTAEFTGSSGSDAVTVLVRVACMVRKINDDEVPFPRSRAEVEARLGRLEREGVDAAAAAIARLGEDAPAAPPAEQAATGAAVQAAA